MKGKLLLLLIAIIIAAVVVYYSVVPSPKPTLALTRIYGLSLEPGQTVEINLTIADVSDLASVRVSLAWDPYILNVTTGDPRGYLISEINYSIFLGPFLKSVSNASQLIVNDVFNAAGNITVIYTGILEEKTASGSGVLATINFTCIHSGTTTIEIVGPRDGHASIQSGTTAHIAHNEVSGLITEMGPLPVWTESGFQLSVIIVEIVITALIPLAIVIKRRPRPKRKPVTKEEEEIEEEET